METEHGTATVGEPLASWLLYLNCRSADKNGAPRTRRRAWRRTALRAARRADLALGGGGEGEREREEREGPRLSKQEVGFTLLAARDLLSKPADSWIVAFLLPPVPSSPLPLTYLLPLAYNHHITIMFTARRDSN